MSHFRLHTKMRERMCLKYVMMGLVCLLAAGTAGYAVHSVGTARAKSREKVHIYTEEEFVEYLLDAESEEYNLNGRYQLEEDLDLSVLEYSIGTNIEPFTGKLDGNGHVIKGLVRPLFGVMKKAEVENLFFHEAEIMYPFTYRDGAGYVDGYGALAAYAVDSVIRNCGMSGGIYTASPSEAEYQLAKASPPDADERRGPGIQDPVIKEGPGVESSPVLEEDGRKEDNKGGGTDIGPGVESSGADGSADDSLEAESSGGNGPGIESSGADSPGTESSGTDNSGTGSSGTDSPGIESSGADSPETESSGTNSPGEESPGTESGTGVETGGETDHHKPEDSTETASGAGNTETSMEENTSTDSGSTSAAPSNEEEESGGEKTTPEAGTEPKAEAGTAEAVKTAASGIKEMETIGVKQNERQYLSMKIPAVVDADAEELLTASPSDATPSDAQKETEEISSDTPNSENDEENVEEERPEYIGNPNGDIYILVTADRITAGGLVAEAAGETLIAGSFVLVTIDSPVEMTDTYAGGIIGSVGDESRLENCFAAGLVDSHGVTAGFAADNRGTVQNCYSTMTIGKRGDIRGAFAATGEGAMTGCVYDRQMACVEEDTNSAGQPAAMALNTSQMTGPEAEIPGDWYLAEGAYPQLEYFALSGQEDMESCSRAAAIALALPDNVTLEDILEEGDLTLPGEVDGREITWEAEGSIIIDGYNQVLPMDSASVSTHDVPVVKSAMEPSIPQETTASLSDQEETIASLSGMPPEEQPDGIQLKASVGAASRNFTLRAVTARASGYLNWEEVGRDVDTGSALSSYQPKLNGEYYEIGTPEALAWFAYKINMGDAGIQHAKVKLTASIELDGESGYGGSKSSPLPWIPIGSTDDSTYFKGTFDGNGFTIDYMKVEQDGYAGLFARAGGGAEIRKLGIGPNSTVTAIVGTSTPEDGTAALVGGVRSEPGVNAQIVITGCYSRASVMGKSSRTGAFVGNGDVEAPGNQRIDNCYVAGPVTIAAGGSGTASAIAGTFANDTATEEGGIKDCYWDAAATGISNRAIWSLDNDSAANHVTVEHADALTQEEMKNGNAVALLNNSQDSPIWAYRPWKTGNDDYPVYYDGTVITEWVQVGEQMDLAGTIPEGSGISGDPYQLKTPEELAWFSYQVGVKKRSGIYARLENDMDLFGSQYTGFTGAHTVENIEHAMEWYPIGNESFQYVGGFEGNRHVIEGMYITKGGARCGFFGYTGDATIRNIGIGSSCVIKAGPGENALLVGSAGLYRTLVIENSFVLGTLMIESGSINRGGAFVGDDIGRATVRIRNCYNAGDTLGFAGLSESSNAPTNCLADISINYKNNWGDRRVLGGVAAVTTEQMKTWGAAYALNGFKLDGPWTFDPAGENYPTWGTLPPARDWKDVGEAMFFKYNVEPFSGGDGSVGNPYRITTAEQLASFGALVNWGNTDIQGILMNDISLAGSAAYGDYSTSSPLPWAPIGDKNHVFTGMFNGNGKVISNMKVAADGSAGMFGWAGGGAEMKGIGFDTTCMVEGGLGAAGAAGEDGTAAVVGTIMDRILIKNCYSRAQVIGKTGTRTGTFVGTYQGSEPGGQAIANCYAAGVIKAGTGTPGAIAGTFSGSASDTYSEIQYCYWDKENTITSGGTLPAVSGTKPLTVNAEGKTAADMNTALAANPGGLLEKLNTNVGIGLWSRDNAKNDGYPTYSSTTITSWEDVVRYVLPPAGKNSSSPGTAGSRDNPYQLRTAEHLAWFAYQVNHGDTGICGELTSDINLFGGMYTGLTYTPGNASMPGNALLWIPIGTDADGKRYVGTFTGNGHQVSIMRAVGSGKQGLFGSVGGSGTVSGIGISNSLITGETAGGVTGSLSDQAVISRCSSQTNTAVTANGTTQSYAGGIAGQVSGTAGIEDCYNLDTVINGTGTTSFAGGIAGGITGSRIPAIKNSYNACGSVGTITVSGGMAGSIAGTVTDNRMISRCYSDKTFAADGDGITMFDFTSDAKRQQQVDELNTLEDGTERIGTSRAWYTSLAAEAARGMPTLTPPKVISITMEPAASKEGRGVLLEPEMKIGGFRGIRQENTGGGMNPEFILENSTTIRNSFQTYGTENANRNLGLMLEHKTKKTMIDLETRLSEASLTGSNATSTANVNTITLNNSAAYTCAVDRTILLDVESLGTRYEIRITIPAVTEKTLSIVMPVEVSVGQLSPNGSLQKSYSGDLTLINNRDYPITGKILSLTPKTGEGYVKLKPVAKSDNYGSTKQLADPDGGVKLGIADTAANAGIVPAEGIYYTPAAPSASPAVEETWMSCKINGKGVLPFRYFLEYEANPYYSDTNQFGYTVSYQFGISKDDVAAVAVQ